MYCVTFTMTYLKYTPIYSVSMCLIHTSTPLIYACIENNTTRTFCKFYETVRFVSTWLCTSDRILLLHCCHTKLTICSPDA